MKCPPVITLKNGRNASSRKVSEQVEEGWHFDRKLLKLWAPSPTVCKEETENWLVFMQSAESAHGGLQKVTAFKKVHGSIVKILVCGSFVWCIWLRAKNCLKWGKIYIALEMVFAGGGEGEEGWDTGCLCTKAFPLGVSSFSFFFRNPSLQELFLHSQNMKVGCRAFFARNASFSIKCYQYQQNVQSSFQNNIYKSGFFVTQTLFFFIFLTLFLKGKTASHMTMIISSVKMKFCDRTNNRFSLLLNQL